MSLVSIIIATYNGEKYIGQQIDSILKSSYQDFEIYICDDGSQDRTMDILRKYEENYPDKIHVKQNENNLGVTLNFLKAICRTTSDYVMLCDQDDIWKIDKIAMTLKRMRHMESQLDKKLPIAVFTDAKVVDAGLNTIEDSFFKASHLNPRKTDLPHLLMENKLIGCTIMINASLRRVIQGFNLPVHAKLHDGWIGLIASSIGKIGYIDETTLLYRQHGNNVVGNQTFISYIKDRISSLKKQKESLHILQRQAQEFLYLYGSIINEENKTIISRFANLSNVSMVQRRLDIIKYGYFKTGLIRNIGLMIII